VIVVNMGRREAHQPLSAVNPYPFNATTSNYRDGLNLLGKLTTQESYPLHHTSHDFSLREGKIDRRATALIVHHITPYLFMTVSDSSQRHLRMKLRR
jgi:hypothetical protein